MKRLFAFILCTLFITPGLFAQTFPGPELFFGDYSEYLRLISGQVKKDGVHFSFKKINKEYPTTEQNEMEMLELGEAALYGQEPIFQAEETHVTDSYNEVTIQIPEGYSINKYIVIDSPYPDLHFPVSGRTIMLTINGKDASFKLDWDVKLTDADNIKEIPTEYINQALTLTLRYSPKYFSLRRDYNNNLAREVKVKHEGEDITLNAEVYPFLIITTPKGTNMSYVLEPNFQNLYNDFKFVREGHKPIKYREIK